VRSREPSERGSRGRIFCRGGRESTALRDVHKEHDEIGRETMMIRLWVTVAILLLAFGTAPAADRPFGGLDANGNGTLEQTELEKAAPKIFKKADRSGDGTLDRNEFKAAGGDPARFDEIDKDRNGRVDLDEFSKAAVERFKQVDTNRDGRIDNQELRSRQKPIENPLLIFYF